MFTFKTETRKNLQNNINAYWNLSLYATYSFGKRNTKFRGTNNWVLGIPT